RAPSGARRTRPKPPPRWILLPRRAGRGGGRLFLAGAAQLITISALVGADPIPASWSSLLLAIAPAPLAAAAAFAPAPVNLPAAVAGAAVLVAGLAGQLTHTGAVCLPALVMLAVAAAKLRREQVLGGSGCDQMPRYLTRDRAAIALALAAPLAAAAILLPFRSSWPNTDVALLLVVLVVGAVVSQLA